MSKIDKDKKEKVDNTDYRVFYFIGIIFMPVGIAITIATSNPAFLGLMVFGLIFLVTSIVNKDKWYGKYD